MHASRNPNARHDARSRVAAINLKKLFDDYLRVKLQRVVDASAEYAIAKSALRDANAQNAGELLFCATAISRRAVRALYGSPWKSPRCAKSR